MGTGTAGMYRGRLWGNQEPLPSQLRTTLASDLVGFGFLPGDLIWTEGQIIKSYGVSRATVREALKLLEFEGLVEARRGFGRYLSPLAFAEVEHPITRFEPQSKLLDELGYEWATHVVGVEISTPNDEVRRELRLAADEETYILTRIRCDAKVGPLIASKIWIPVGVIPEPDGIDWKDPLTQTLTRQGSSAAYSVAHIVASDGPADVEDACSVDRYTSWLCIKETVVSDAGVPVFFATDHHRGDLFSFNVLRR